MVYTLARYNRVLISSGKQPNLQLANISKIYSKSISASEQPEKRQVKNNLLP